MEPKAGRIWGYRRGQECRGTEEVRSVGVQRSVRNLQSDGGREARPYLKEEGEGQTVDQGQQLEGVEQEAGLLPAGERVRPPPLWD